MLNLKVLSLSCASWLAIIFLSCVTLGLVAPAFHNAAFLEAIFPGFRWISFTSFLLGLIESLLYGAYAGFTYGLIYNVFQSHYEKRIKPTTSS